MPAGGRFALEAIRRAKGQTDAFKQKRTLVSLHCDQAYRDWLPPVFEKKRVQPLAGTDEDRMFDHSLQTGYERIIESLNDYDATAKSFLSGVGWDEERIAAAFTRLTGGSSFGATPYKNIEIKRSISELPSRLFKSKYFSAIVELAKTGPLTDTMTDLARSTNQLYLGAHGQNAVLSLADQPLVNAPEDNPAFQELGQMFAIHPVDAGVAAFKAVMKSTDEQELQDETIFPVIARMVLESAVERFLDYRSIVDDLLPALFRPRDKWGQFTKIFTFLMGTREYMLQKEPKALEMTSGYYHDLIGRREFEIATVGTANYTSLATHALASVYNGSIVHLNGSLNEYLDPYKSEVLLAPATIGINRFLVPFLFTQSGIKPLTSVDVSRRYVQYYDSLIDSDAAIILGFGFNADDGHINSLFRKAVEEKNMRLIILKYAASGKFDTDEALEEARRFLRLDRSDQITVLPVNKSRKVEGEPWVDAVLESLGA
jgi:hypothetical protein